jgi:hypothetical protein
MHRSLKLCLGMAALSSIASLLAARRVVVVPQAADPQVSKLVERITSAPVTLGHARVQMQQVDVVIMPADQQSLSNSQREFFATYIRKPQPDGSLVLTDRVDGDFENSSPGVWWMTLHRIGGDGHINVEFADGTASYNFLTRYPQSISRSKLSDQQKQPGVPTLRWGAEELAREVKQAASVRIRGREVTQGILCEVIDISMKKEAKDGALRWGDKEALYYAGVTDGLIYRSVETQWVENVRNYREVLYQIDAASPAKDMSYSRFETEVKSLLRGKPLPPVVDK